MSSSKIKGIEDDYLKQNENFIQYCNLRIESYRLINKALIENSDQYDKRIKQINEEIDNFIE